MEFGILVLAFVLLESDSSTSTRFGKDQQTRRDWERSKHKQEQLLT